jgi:hypothetical protein
MNNLPKEIQEILEQTAHLGNHYQKNIQVIEKIFPELQTKIEATGLAQRIDLSASSKNYQRDMADLVKLSGDTRTILNYLGCYYSLQLLWFNLANLDWFDYQLSYNHSRHSTYKKFMLKSGQQFRKLSAAYMHFLLDIFQVDKNIPRYIVTGVGTRSDQDDIDVGIIDDGSGDRAWLNQMIHKLGMEMMRFASNLHFHLSEHVGHEAYSASIPEYEELLTNRIGNFVILTEMLGSAFILGDTDLFDEFQRKVTDKYYFRGEPNRYHEGYLRGIVGEIIDLTSVPHDPEYIHPKHDGLRIIKNLIYAYKVRLNIAEVNPWRILGVTRKQFPHFKSEFRQLVVQEELIFTTEDICKENLQRVALKFHFENIGPHLARYQLLQEYTKAIQAFRKVLPVFIDDLTNHLHQVSIFNQVLDTRVPQQSTFKNLLSQLDFFQTVHFWDDFFTLLREKTPDFNKNLFTDLNKMSPEQRFQCMKQLSEWTGNQPEFIFNFCLTFSQASSFGDIYQFNNLTQYYITRYQNDPDFLQNLITLFQKKPSLICRIMQICSTRTLDRLHKIVYQKTLRGKRSFYQKNLAELIGLTNSCSYYFKRFITNIYNHFPGYSCFIQDPEMFHKEQSKVLRHLRFVQSFNEKKKLLGHYYDLNFFGLGLETFKGLDVKTINHRFTHFVNEYIKHLFMVCLSEVSANNKGNGNKKRIPPDLSAARLLNSISDKIVIYACGGNGREQAFDDDFDLIVLADELSDLETEIVRETLALMNSEMIKRGTLPHFRFSQHFGEYISPFQGLIDLLQSDYSDNYIDMSQLLECRPLVGSRNLHQKMTGEVVKNLIFSMDELYITQMIREINRRHGSTTFFKEKCANIKECTGGLRDIEMIVLIYKVLYKNLETEPFKLIREFITIDRKFKKQWKTINNSLLFLQKFRYVYRLTVAAEDQIYSDGLTDVVKRLHPESLIQTDPSEWLWNQFIFHRKETWGAMHQLLRAID